MQAHPLTPSYQDVGGSPSSSAAAREDNEAIDEREENEDSITMLKQVFIQSYIKVHINNIFQNLNS